MGITLVAQSTLWLYQSPRQLPPSQYAAQIGKITKKNLIGSGVWPTRTVAKLLATEIFTGDMVQGKMKTIDHKQYPVPEKDWIVVHNTHEPIISHEMFDAVKVYREQVAAKSMRAEKIGYSENLLRGKIFCACCKKNVHRQRCHDEYIFHCISNSRIAKGTCAGITIREKDLFEAIMCILRKQVGTFVDKCLALKDSTSKSIRFAARCFVDAATMH